MYDELWTAGKCMYKLEPVLADGGELIIYAPHLNEICVSHGRHIEEIGYHCRDYFLKQWDKFKHYPWGVLAHSTHVRGIGVLRERRGKMPRPGHARHAAFPTKLRANQSGLPRSRRRSARRILPNREDEGVLLVPKAGEMLYQLKNPPAWAGGSGK